jgi:phage portal protein BeeE
VYYLREEIAIFVPMRDPMAPTRGMSWMRPAVREITADSAMSAHRIAFFRNGATPNLVVTGIVPATNQTLADWTEKFRAKNEGVRNAYKTMFFSAGVDAKVVGADLKHIDFKVVQGAGETRLAAAAGVPPVVAGLSEGLQGSSLNAGNFASSMRRFADLTGRPWWADAFASLASIVPPPRGAELWYDDRDIPALKDDIKDAAEVLALHAQAIRSLGDGGYDQESVIDAVVSGDLKRLKPTGLLSVQLQPPMPEGPPEPEVEEPDEEPADE